MESPFDDLIIVGSGPIAHVQDSEGEIEIDLKFARDNPGDYKPLDSLEVDGEIVYHFLFE